MDFALTPRMMEMQSHLQVFIDRHILPANVEWHREVEAGRYPMALFDRLKDRAKAEGLWNLFLPGLREDEPGTRLSNLEYAPACGDNGPPTLVLRGVQLQRARHRKHGATASLCDRAAERALAHPTA